MKQIILLYRQCRCFIVILLFTSCHHKASSPSQQTIDSLYLKQGSLALCGNSSNEFGRVEFITSCSENTQKDFALAMALLHSFEYDEAEKVFARIIAADPLCAMAYWGVAMCNYHQVWPSPHSPEELAKGAKAILVAKSLKSTGIESELINAMAVFYNDYANVEHSIRKAAYLHAMEKIYLQNKDEPEVAILYALALIGTADPADKTYVQQRKAGRMLIALSVKYPEHPGIVHYIIHSYDYPELAPLALNAAREYTKIAPASAHAQHMPSHIFTRLGLWDESIRSNLLSTYAAQCYAHNAGMKGHWDEEMHGLDYLVYAYLQKGDNSKVLPQLEYLKSITKVFPQNFKVAYTFAAVPARYLLENKLWKQAAVLPVQPGDFPWKRFPWQESIFHFARVLGLAHTGNIEGAKKELKILEVRRDTLNSQKDSYKANQVAIQIKIGEAWIAWGEKKTDEALKLMLTAAAMEDKTEKSPVTPGEVLPAKELLGDMLILLNKPGEALVAYEDDLKKRPNRFNSLYGAARSSEKSKDHNKASGYYTRLIQVADSSSTRPELLIAHTFLTSP